MLPWQQDGTQQCRNETEPLEEDCATHCDCPDGGGRGGRGAVRSKPQNAANESFLTAESSSI